MINMDLAGKSSCYHSPFYSVREQDSPNSFCGLCWLQFYLQEEIPFRLHAYKTLAENGNPQTSPAFLSHLEATFGLRPPEPGTPLHIYRRAREQYTKPPSREIFPVTASLWSMMGYQPPLAKPLIWALTGMGEPQIAARLEVSQYNVYDRLSKGIRLALRNIRA